MRWGAGGGEEEEAERNPGTNICDLEVERDDGPSFVEISCKTNKRIVQCSDRSLAKETSHLQRLITRHDQHDMSILVSKYYFPLLWYTNTRPD